MKSIKCPHCLHAVYLDSPDAQLKGGIGYAGISDNLASWRVEAFICPACGRVMIEVIRLANTQCGELKYWAYPKSSTRPIPPEVPDPYAQDYKEASLILNDSPKASAALGRRILQMIIREKAGIKDKDLNKEIDQLLATGRLPTHLAQSIDAIRHLGNFAAHPVKYQQTGAIVEVEPQEAEWTLNVLDRLFDFYFVQPAIIQKQRDDLNAKLQASGKPLLK